jgi:sugar lactone lactonase YvrE
MVLLTVALAGCSADALLRPSSPTVKAAVVAHPFPDVIALPDGFFPEGIAFGRGTTFYVGSLSTGAIFRGDARTGTGDLLVPAQPGREQVGMKYDQRGDRLFVAGGFAGQAYVYDASTGATLAVYQLADPAAGPTLVNDVVVSNDAAYFTDSFRPVIYRVPLGTSGALPAGGAVQEIPLTGEFEFIPNTVIGNANGIAATPNGKQLLLVNTTTGRLYLVDPLTGQATEIDLGGGAVQDGDGILLVGHTLYVVQGPLDRIAVVRLSPDFTSGVIERTITDPDLRFPSTIAAFGSSLYAVNARFDVAPGPDVEYQVVRVSR